MCICILNPSHWTYTHHTANDQRHGSLVLKGASRNRRGAISIGETDHQQLTRETFDDPTTWVKALYWWDTRSNVRTRGTLRSHGRSMELVKGCKDVQGINHHDWIPTSRIARLGNAWLNRYLEVISTWDAPFRASASKMTLPIPFQPCLISLTMKFTISAR